MPCTKGLGNYKFCTNSPYYNGLLEYFENNKANTGKIPNINCVLSTTTMKFKENLSAQNICKEFIILYKFFRDYKGKHTEEDIYSYSDCDFLNYWLNDKLRNSVKDGDKIDVRGFYREIKSMNQELFSKTEDLENYMNNIDPKTLDNMKLLYDLYYHQRKILNMLLDEDYTDPKNNPCSVYTKDCHEKYATAINRCYGIYDEFCKALKDFKISYNIVIEQETEDKYNCKGSTHFSLPTYDSVLEREKKNLMLIQGLTSSLIVLLMVPLIYKFTPFGPFLQEKIKSVKNMWKSPKKNMEKMLSSSMDIGNNISDNRKYKLVYNSVTNE
ncbi:VIR protein [Plasmodium vivax]|uniref:VIR protein n=1 Tax=Plasmodium vivax TaxID=5855 RepID=A0A1G4H7R8_PLAVI|nr:VIR protein [Plasmodium vivax]